MYHDRIYVVCAGTDTGEVKSDSKMLRYVFTEDKIMVYRNENVINNPYSGIERVTQNTYYYKYILWETSTQ